jgi:hypothetical protein
LKELEGLLRDCGLRVKGHKLVKSDEGMACIVDAYGSLEEHEQAMERLFSEEDVKEFRY